MTIRAKLIHAREALGLTQVELAEKLQVAQTAICRIEKGDIMPPADVAARIIHLLGVSLEDIVSPTPEEPKLGTVVGRFAYLRDTSGMSLEKIGALADVPPNTLGMILREQIKDPGVGIIVRIAQLFRVDLEWLLLGCGDPPTKGEIQAAIKAAWAASAESDVPIYVPRKARRSKSTRRASRA